MHQQTTDVINRQQSSNEMPEQLSNNNSVISQQSAAPFTLLSPELTRKLIASTAYSLAKQWSIPPVVAPLTEDDRAFLRSHNLRSIATASRQTSAAAQITANIVTNTLTPVITEALHLMQHIQPSNHHPSIRINDVAAQEFSLAQGTLVASADLGVDYRVSDISADLFAPSSSLTLSSEVASPIPAASALSSATTGAPCDTTGFFRQALNGCIGNMVINILSPPIIGHASACISGAGTQVVIHELGCGLSALEVFLQDELGSSSRPPNSNNR